MTESWRNQPVGPNRIACMRTGGQVNFYQVARIAGITESTVVRYYATGKSRKADAIEAGRAAYEQEDLEAMKRHGFDSKPSPHAIACRKAWRKAWAEHQKRPITRGRLADIFDDLVWSKHPTGGLSFEA